MLKTWLTMGVMMGALVAGCDDGRGDDGLGGSADNLRGRGGKHAPDASKDGPRDDVKPAPSPADASIDTPPASCAALLCPANTRCVVKEVQCIRAPCPPIASCEPIDQTGAGTCAVTLCKQGTTCVEGDDGAKCVPSDGAGSCAVTLCKDGTKCVEGDEGAKCVPLVDACASVRCKSGTHCVAGDQGATCEPDEVGGSSCAVVLCKAGTICEETSAGAKCVEQKCTAKCSANQHCELQEVQCIRAPCPPIPTCVDNAAGCDTVRCKSGTHCVETTVQCLVAPCPVNAECVVD